MRSYSFCLFFFSLLTYSTAASTPDRHPVRDAALQLERVRVQRQSLMDHQAEQERRMIEASKRSAAAREEERAGRFVQKPSVYQLSGSASIEGVVADDDGNPIAEIDVSVESMEGHGGSWTTTDADGFYQLTVTAGRNRLWLDSGDLIPDYMSPRDKEVRAEEGATVVVDFVLYVTDATITGVIMLDDSPLVDVSISADGSTGWTNTSSQSDGTFTLDVASEADASGGYAIWVDTWNLTQAAHYEENYRGVVSGTANLTIQLRSPSAWVEGKVTDEDANPLADIRVDANQHSTGNHAEAYTDADGYFKLGVIKGRWWVQPDSWYTIPEYLVPHGEEVAIDEGATVTQDFVAYSADATISGTVHYEGVPLFEPFSIGVHSELGWTETKSREDGTYLLPVASEADTEGGYSVWLNNWSLPPDLIVQENYNDVMSGATDIDFHVVPPTSRIEGKVADESGDPIPNVRVWANREDGGGAGAGAMTDASGFFSIGVMHGRWRIGVDGGYLRPDYLTPNDKVVRVEESATVTVDMTVYSTDAAITGTVTLDGAPVADLGVETRSRLGRTQTVTDHNGSYTLSVASAADSEGGYHVWLYDLELAEKVFILNVYYNLPSNSSGINFRLTYANAWVEGKVLDDDDTPITDVTVYVNSDVSPWNQAQIKTDELGYYKVGVVEGEWHVRVDVWGLIPHYMASRDTVLFVAEGATEMVDLSAYKADATITGTVYLDESPIREIGIQANAPLGWTETKSTEDGSYTLSVASEADTDMGYSVSLHDWELPDNTYVEKRHYDNVLSGSSGIEFHIHKTLSAFEGHVFSLATGEPVDNGWVWARDEAKDWDRTVGTQRNGKFRMAVPNGTYDIFAGAGGYDGQLVERDVEILDEVMEYNIYLEGDGPTVTLDGDPSMPQSFALHANYPNPFNPTTTILYDLPESATVHLVIYDVLGKQIKTLVNQPHDAGVKTAVWDGTDDLGRPVSAGVYLYQIQAGGFSKTKKMVLLK